MRRFQVSQTLKMKVPNEEIPIEYYLRQPQRLVQAVTDARRIQPLASDQFRLQLRTLQFMMLQIESTVDLQVWTSDTGALHLRSLDCEIRGAAFLSQSFRLELEGILTPQRQGTITELQGQADLTIQVDIPPPLMLIPEAVLESSGEAFLSGILLTVKYRLERQLLQDYRRWVKANPLTPVVPSAMPAGNPAS
jgi:hypothetical protein